MAFQSKLIKLEKENELRYRDIFLPISVVMMSVQVFRLFLAIKKLKASIKGCERWGGVGGGLHSGYYCFNGMTKSLGCNNVRPTGGKERCCVAFNISFIRSAESGRKRWAFWMARWVEQAAQKMTRVRPPFWQRSIAALQLGGASQIELGHFARQEAQVQDAILTLISDLCISKSIRADSVAPPEINKSWLDFVKFSTAARREVWLLAGKKKGKLPLCEDDFFWNIWEAFCVRSPFMLACANAWCNTSDARAKRCEKPPTSFLPARLDCHTSQLWPINESEIEWDKPLRGRHFSRKIAHWNARLGIPFHLPPPASNLLRFQRSWCLAVATHLPRNPPVDWLRPLIPQPWRWTCERHQKRKPTCVKTGSNLPLNWVWAALDSSTDALGLLRCWQLYTKNIFFLCKDIKQTLDDCPLCRNQLKIANVPNFLIQFKTWVKKL